MNNEQKSFHYYPQSLIRNFTNGSKKIKGYSYNYEKGEYIHKKYNTNDLFRIYIKNNVEKQMTKKLWESNAIFEKEISESSLETNLLEVQNLFSKEKLVELTYEHEYFPSILFQITRSDGIDQTMALRHELGNMIGYTHISLIVRLLTKMMFHMPNILFDKSYKKFGEVLSDEEFIIKFINEHEASESYMELFKKEIELTMYVALFQESDKSRNFIIDEKTRIFLYEHSNSKMPLISRPSGLTNCHLCKEFDENTKTYDTDLIRDKIGYIQLSPEKTILIFNEDSRVMNKINDFIDHMSRSNSFANQTYDSLFKQAMEIIVLNDIKSLPEFEADKVKFFNNIKDVSANNFLKKAPGTKIFMMEVLKDRIETLDRNLSIWLEQLIENVYPIYGLNNHIEAVEKMGLPTKGYNELISCKTIEDLKSLIDYQSIRKKVIDNFYDIMTN